MCEQASDYAYCHARRYENKPTGAKSQEKFCLGAILNAIPPIYQHTSDTVALVEMSISEAGRPRKRSLTQPPAIKAAKPQLWSL